MRRRATAICVAILLAVAPAAATGEQTAPAEPAAAAKAPADTTDAETPCVPAADGSTSCPPEATAAPPVNTLEDVYGAGSLEAVLALPRSNPPRESPPRREVR